MKAEGGKGTRVVSPARRAAFNILRRVEEEGAYASVLLAASDAEMRADDRALEQQPRDARHEQHDAVTECRRDVVRVLTDPVREDRDEREPEE